MPAVAAVMLAAPKQSARLVVADGYSLTRTVLDSTAVPESDQGFAAICTLATLT